MIVALLLSLLGHPSYSVRAAAHESLAALATPAELGPFLDSRDPEVRARVAQLIQDIGYRKLRLELERFRDVPYIDAIACWRGGAAPARLLRHLDAAKAWHLQHGFPMHHEAGWPEYRQAMRLALDAGDVWPDPCLWLEWSWRTECFRVRRSWE